MMTMDMREMMNRVLKYLVEGTVVAVVAFVIPQHKMKVEEVAVIALTAAATFAVLDMFAPSVGHSVRQGAGFGIGANLVGFPRM